MASDVYLQINGINGGSNDDKHKWWIEVEAVDWGVIQPTAGTMSTAGGHTIGHTVFDALRITKAVDLASPKLMELAAQGKTIPKAKLEFFRHCAVRSAPSTTFSCFLNGRLGRPIDRKFNALELGPNLRTDSVALLKRRR